MLMLGKFCMHGHGVPTDYQSALAWFDKAVRTANEEVSNILDPTDSLSQKGEAALYKQVAEEAGRASRVAEAPGVGRRSIAGSRLCRTATSTQSLAGAASIWRSNSTN